MRDRARRASSRSGNENGGREQDPIQKDGKSDFSLSIGKWTTFLLVEGKDNPGRYDQEFFLAIHHWEPYFAPMAEIMQENSSQLPATSGSDVAYKRTPPSTVTAWEQANPYA